MLPQALLTPAVGYDTEALPRRYHFLALHGCQALRIVRLRAFYARRVLTLHTLCSLLDPLLV